MPEWQNRLMLGDNLRMLREYVADESVDLIYLDPPFNSNATYNVLFKERSGSASVAQITAFEDTWQWGPESESMYREIMLAGLGKLSDMLQAFRSALGPNDMMAYLVMMAPRLVELRRVLKSTGSLYLHCDPTASHYLKTLVDAVFEPSGFRNEIVWERTSSHNRLVRYGPVHDIILFYTKSQSWQWNPQHMPYDPKYVDAFYRHIEEGTGRRYRLDNITSNKPGGRYLWKGSPPPGKRYWGYSHETMEAFEKGGRLIYSRNGIPQYKRYLDEMPGQLLQDMWTDIPPISSQAKERLGYPTQKPEALLERIIQASSNRGDVVLDPFCGCGTAIAVAERLGRKWIGVDITHLAISLMKSRLRSAYGDDLAPYEVIGSPMDEASARALLAEPDGRYQFQWWACGLIDAHPAHDKKKGADSGIDGYLYFFDDTSNTAKKVVVQVKSGKVNVGDIRDFRGVIEREGAVMGAFITLERPSKPMNVEAASAGFYEPTAFHGLRRFPKIQILTIEALLAGQGLRLPPARIDTYRMAPRREKRVAKKNQLIRG